MRIIQFPNIVTREESKVCYLRNCNVVIDGQNFFYPRYENSRLNFIYGCDANAFATYLKKELTMFKRANVRCYIVLKGGDTDIEKKIKKFSHVGFDSLEADFEFVAPILTKDSIAQTLHEMGLRHEYCVAEVKDDCVALAQKLQCPLISQDIEYCFRKAAYIPKLTMKFNNATNSIECRQYKLEEFLKKHSLTEEKTALFATISDSQIFPQDFFATLLENWGVSSQYFPTQHKNLIAWLSRHTEEQARNDITRFISNEDDKNKFWSSYEKKLKNMTKVEGGHTTEYLINPDNLKILPQDPEWFEKGVISKRIPEVYVNLYKWGVIEGTKVIEDESRDHLLLSIDIVKYAYNLLTNYSGDPFKLYQDADNFIEIDSGDLNIRRPNYECRVSVFENGWDKVKSLKLFEHFLSENNIDTSVLAEVPDDAAILLISLVYLARKKQMENQNVTTQVYANLLSYVIINYVINKSAFKRQINNLKEKDCLEAFRATEKYFESTHDEHKRIFDKESVMRVQEWEYCLQHMNYLNTLCGKPFESACFIKIYNGTFIYKIYYESRDEDCDDFLQKLLERAPSVMSFVKRLVQVYKKLLNCK